MTRNQKHVFSLIAAALLLLIYLFQDPEIQSTQPDFLNSSTNTSTLFLVTRVIDGDTIELETGDKVRYIGVNTPESVDPRREVQCFGNEASAYNKNLVLNKKVKLQKDVSEVDKYGRLLRYVYLEDETFVNLKLVADGYAYASAYPPDVARSEEFLQAQNQARAAGLGLWSACQKS